MSLKSYLTRKLSVRKFRLSDVSLKAYLPNRKRLSRAFRHHILYRLDQLPPKVDLRPDMTPIENQSRSGSSVANCLAGAYEYLTKKSNGLDIDVSRLFIYYNARANENKAESIIDSGCSMTSGIEALEQFGTCLETIWPYDISRVNIRPDDQAYQQAEAHKIHEAFPIDLDLHEMKACLAQGFPFAFGLRLFSSFVKAAQTGIVPMPNIWDSNQQSDGSHALLAVGYSDQSQAFIVRNSWGEDWGDKGYCYIPYGYLTNSDLCFDIWTIRKLINDDFGREYWHYNDAIDYLNNNCPVESIDENSDEEYSTNQTNWRDYYNRKNVIDDSWNHYRSYEKKDFWRNDEDYFDDRHRQDRYDRNNEPFDQQYGGYINNSFNTNRNMSYPFYDRYQDEDKYYNNYHYNRFEYNDRKATF